MKLSSPAFKHQGVIPSKYTCVGMDINPPLEIADVPQGAQSLALIMDDPDVPKNLRPDGMYIHWVAYNIDPKITTIPEAISRLGTHGKNTEGKNRYKGPCPPDREHRYFFKLYALDTQLNLTEGITKEKLLEEMEGHILAQCELMGRFEKPRKADSL